MEDDSDAAAAAAGAANNNNRVSSSNPYWLDACEDISISCDDFIDFDVSDDSEHLQQQPNNNNSNNNQDFFGGIDRIFDSIKNGAGLPDHPPVSASADDGNQLPPTHLQLEQQNQQVGEEEEEQERFNKRARLTEGERRINHQPNNKDRYERCFNNNRKRPRNNNNNHNHSFKRDVKGYWERDKSSNDLVFRSGTWEPNLHTPQHKMDIDNPIKQEKPKETVPVPEEKARQYQLDVLEQAKTRNTIAFLETGAGKTLIAVLLIKSIHETLHLQNKKMLAVFLVPKVPLVYQVNAFAQKH